MVWHQTCYIMLHGFTNSKCVQHKFDMIPFGTSHVVSCLFITTFHVARANSFTLFTAHKDLTVGLSAKFQYHWTTANKMIWFMHTQHIPSYMRFSFCSVLLYFVTGRFHPYPSGPLFTKRWDVLPPNLVKSRSHEIGCYNDSIARKYDRHPGSATAEMPCKFRAIAKVQTRISRLRDFPRSCGKTSYRLVNRNHGNLIAPVPVKQSLWICGVNGLDDTTTSKYIVMDKFVYFMGHTAYDMTLPLANRDAATHNSITLMA